MNFGLSFLLIVFFTIVTLFGLVTNQKPFPTVPQDFTCIVEVTHVPNKETRTLIEWYDTVNNVAKVETHRHNDSIATIYKNVSATDFLGFCTFSKFFFPPFFFVFSLNNTILII